MPDDGPAKDGKEGWLNLLQEVGRAVIPAVLTAGGLLGFIAFAGSVIVWTRFQAAQVPPDQVVAAYPRGELVAIASALLLLFGFVGALAVIGLFLINRKAEATLAMNRGLLALLAVEGLVAICIAEAPSTLHRILACELFLLPMVAAFWATYLYDKPPPEAKKDAERENEGEEEQGRVGDLRDEVVSLISPRTQFRNTVITVTVLVAAGAAIAVHLIGLQSLTVAIVALPLIALLPTLRFAKTWWIEEEDGKGEQSELVLKAGEIPFTREGMALILAALPAAAIGPWLVLDSWWVAVSLLAAAILVAGLWRIAVISPGKFMWYGLAVFISVPLFGTLTLMARNIADPQVQPMALIRKDDGPDESIQGLYVTETENRIYFATVATEGCSNHIVPHSGRLLWVPKSEVVALSIGPLQSIDDAASTALEMSYAITPAVETPAGDHVSLTVAEKRKTATREGQEDPRERRLESVGAAVQPNFGAGIRLDPERVSPGDVVTLRMSSPNRENGVHGFGRLREGRTLRLGGIPVDVVKEEAHTPWDAEYVETGEGEALKLTKQAVYAQRDDEYVRVELGSVTPDEPLFVELNDDSVAEVDDHGLASGRYLRLEERDSQPPRLANASAVPPAVTLEDGTEPVLKPRLLRQAWHEAHIRFRVPTQASTGPVTVECEQLSGQPLLRIARAPEARIVVRIEPGSHRVTFDSRGSRDDSGKIVSRRWSREGLDRGRKMQIAEDLPPRLESYAVRLTVTDSEGQSGTAEIHLLRLPEDLVSFNDGRPMHPNAMQRAKAALRRATAAEPADTIEFDARPGDTPRRALGPSLSLSHVERARRALLRTGSAQASSAATTANGLAVKSLTFDDDCPAVKASDEGRLDILVLGRGTRVVPSQQCLPRHVNTTHWLLPPP